MSPVCFLDNDIILKLVACNLFSEAIGSLNIDESDLRVLGTAQFVFKKGRLAQDYSEDIRNYAVAIAQKCLKVKQEDIDIKIISDLEKIKFIDPGESLLTAATFNEESFYLTTGDKRYVTALGTATEIDYIKAKLTGRVICFEQVIRRIIYRQGFDYTLAKVLPGRQYDKALKAIFGSGEKSTEENVMMTLEGYIRDLREKADGLLIDF